MVNELAGKVAVVTGGASGLGAATVDKFIAEGARVVFGDVDREGGAQLVHTYGKKARFEPTDVADPEQMSKLISVAVDEFGGLQIMVNNAGISSAAQKSFIRDDLADFDRVMSVNVLGVMLGTREAARHMAAAGGGSIINVSSIGGIQAGPGVMTYRASKAAVLHFTKSVAIELAYYNIRVNCIAPGSIPTPILESSAMKANMSREATEEFVRVSRERMRANRPLNREGTPDDVAEAALYFANDRSGYVTGTVLPVDGGTSAGMVIPRPPKSSAEQSSAAAT
ncbi:SDR family NAD(P)-dependent oxidoreductase [Mycobacterium sp.]|uniref:SDR family NAD(P)-dependent oxidoreductase n=1 Tax=Mycobacterium sp. TaxID=1785 RepID=UPI003C72DF04